MKKHILFILCLGILSCPATSAKTIYSLIKRGLLKEASDSLSQQSTASLRDGNHLFYLGLLESNGDKTAQLLEASLAASVAAIHRQEIYHLLAQYYLTRGRFDRLSVIVTDYRSKWEDGRYRKEMLRYSVLADQLTGSYDAALNQTDRYLGLYSEAESVQLGKIDKARTMLAFKKRIGAIRLLKELSRKKEGQGVSQALYLLTEDAISRKRTDDAVFYYNLLREGFPSAVGLDPLMDRMMNSTTSETSDDAAERLTGTFYSVQLGVFSKKGNAKKLASIFKSYGKKIEIKDKKISDVKYHVVYAGWFRNYSEAVTFRDKLQAEHDELFQVVAR